MDSLKKETSFLSSGAVLIGASIFQDMLFNHSSLYMIGGLVLGGVITSLNFVNPNKKFDSFFKGANIKSGEGKYPTIKEIEKTEHGEKIHVNMPPGMSFYDLKQEKIEKALKTLIKKPLKIHETLAGNTVINTYDKDILGMKPFTHIKTGSYTSVALGHSLEGPLHFDFRDWYHLLIAGATGFGKSVMLRSLITSLILNSKPSELSLYLVDFKRVELGIFEPSDRVAWYIEDTETFGTMLSSMGEESKRRYGLFKKASTNNIDTYNKGRSDKLKRRIVIIDEFASLAEKENKPLFDMLKQRLALDRAAGIHYVICTQRPSADVLPGIIKTNVPAKISFRVGTQIDSGIILDEKGAESLREKGEGILKIDECITFKGMYLTENEAEDLIRHTFVKKKKEGQIKKIERGIKDAKGAGQKRYIRNRKF